MTIIFQNSNNHLKKFISKCNRLQNLAAAFSLTIGCSLIPLTSTLAADKPDSNEKFAVPFSRLPEPVSDSDYHDQGEPSAAKVVLGQRLFFDKELSGNRNISCASCHHPLAGTGDGLSLPVGEGGVGLSVTRNTGIGSDAVHERVPRNAPPLFNLGAKEFATLFHDGRLEIDPSQPSGFFSPAGADLPLGLDNPLAAQAMFPVTSATEMAGQPGENDIADAAAIDDLAGHNGVWALLAHRLAAIPKYVDLFKAAFPHIQGAADIRFVDAANAIAAYEASTWRADDSPFDRYLRGDNDAMSPAALNGMVLFYGEAKCATCHTGPFQTDHNFYAIGIPQLGPGKGHGSDGRDDFGRGGVTGVPEDRYRFRTPTLRNVALTGPWGHDGAYSSLEAMIKHHLKPRRSLHNYDTSQAVLPSRLDLDSDDFTVHNDLQRREILEDAIELPQVKLTEEEIDDVVEFLHALTDKNSLDMRDDVPMSVPSDLPVYD